jgi:hypothetical protein
LQTIQFHVAPVAFVLPGNHSPLKLSSAKRNEINIGFIGEENNSSFKLATKTAIKHANLTIISGANHGIEGYTGS